LWTAVAEKAELPMTFERGAAWTAAAKARRVIEESMVPAELMTEAGENRETVRGMGIKKRGQLLGLISS
jgi:hypothetical protein